MMSLVWPWLLAVVPLPWLIRRWVSPAPEQATAALRVPHFQDMVHLPSVGIGENLQRHSSAWFWFGLVIWLLLVLAAARPQWIGEPVGLPTSGRDLMLAVDISGSMEIPDFSINGQEVNRLEVVKRAAGEFISRRTGDRVGLIVFGSQAYVQTPLTFDRETVKTLLQETEIGLAGKETAIGDAIGLAVKRLKEQPTGSRVLVLLTDGANTTGEVSPKQAGDLAKEQGLRIYTIGVGADSMEVDSFFGSRTVNPSRDLDENTLRHLAQSTGGLYLRAKNTEALANIYTELDRLEPASTETELFRPKTELFIWPLGLALGCSVLMALSLLVPHGMFLGSRQKVMGVNSRTVVEQ
mgnify:CR=1 FL=1